MQKTLRNTCTVDMYSKYNVTVVLPFPQRMEVGRYGISLELPTNYLLNERYKF